jgi:hypothetical protein
VDAQRLANYEQQEIERVLAGAKPVLDRGHIAEPSDLYPEIDLPDHLGWAGGLVPLPLLLLLYERVALYVPPKTRDDLAAKWHLSLDAVNELSARRVIQPLIGHPADYAADHFTPLLEQHPPSVWARGVGLLRELGLGHIVDWGDCPLPVDDMATLPHLMERFRRHFPMSTDDELREKVRLEILTNYADLVIFGESEVANSIAKESDLLIMAKRLFLASELRAYPILFGLGGTANYDLSELHGNGGTTSRVVEPSRLSDARVVPANLQMLLEGLGLSVSRLTPRDILEFHSSGRGQALRAAVEYFEAEAREVVVSDSETAEIDQYLEAAEAVQSQLREAVQDLSSPQMVRAISKSRKRIEMVIIAGALVVGAGIGGLLGEPIGGAAGGSGVAQFILKRTELIDRATARRFSPGISNLWRASGRE